MTASLLAGAATRSLITGQDFGKSLREALPDAIASTVGNMIAGAVKSKIDEARLKARTIKRSVAEINDVILGNGGTSLTGTQKHEFTSQLSEA